MTYMIQLLAPHAQNLLDALVKLNLIKFVNPANNDQILVANEEKHHTKSEHLADIAQSFRDMKAPIRGEIALPTMDDILNERVL
jgi:hypothetical protein